MEIPNLIDGPEKTRVLHNNGVEIVFAFGRNHAMPSIFDRVASPAGTNTITKKKGAGMYCK
jgi:hypothetical protein